MPKEKRIKPMTKNMNQTTEYDWAFEPVPNALAVMPPRHFSQQDRIEKMARMLAALTPAELYRFELRRDLTGEMRVAIADCMSDADVWIPDDLSVPRFHGNPYQVYAHQHPVYGPFPRFSTRQYSAERYPVVGWEDVPF
jgi:hypothetical protein